MQNYIGKKNRIFKAWQHEQEETDRIEWSGHKRRERH